MTWNPRSLVTAAQRAQVDFEVESDWLKVDPYGSKFQPVGIVWHHTACPTLAKGNMPSLNYCKNPGIYAGKARACHIVVGRNGKLQIIAGRGAYHAGEGGPLRVNGKTIPKDLGNYYLLGIEIEASSTAKVNKRNLTIPKSGMNPAQLEATARFCAELFNLLKWPTSSAIRHQDWAPGRKADVALPLATIRESIQRFR